MRWPFKRKHQTTEGERARKRAEAELERVRAETCQWEALGAELREIRHRNHLAETFLSATRRKL